MPDMKPQGSSVVELLKNDHRKVEKLFEDFEAATTKRERLKITKQVIEELTVHAKVEEKLVYPILLEEKEEEDGTQEAYEEHHVVKGLLADLSKMDGSEDNFKAKMKVLSELVKHHVKEEEGELLPALEESGEDLEALGQEVLEAKEKLMARKARSTRTSSAKKAAKQEHLVVPRKLARRRAKNSDDKIEKRIERHPVALVQLDILDYPSRVHLRYESNITA